MKNDKIIRSHDGQIRPHDQRSHGWSFFIHLKPPNVITLGPRESDKHNQIVKRMEPMQTDHNKRLITITVA
jgi:hypothetical protein